MKRFCNFKEVMVTGGDCGKLARYKLRNTEVCLCAKHAKEFRSVDVVDVDYGENYNKK